MTNGTSQGLFVVIAIIIFGIFIFISYLLFRDTLKPSLGGIFTDGLEQGLCSLKGYCPTDIEAEREDKDFVYAKIRSGKNGETDIWVQARKLYDGNLQLYKSSTTDNNYTYGSTEMSGNIEIPDSINGMSITKIGGMEGNVYSPFRDAKFDGNLTLPNSILTIGKDAFRKSKFEGNLALPNNLIEIGQSAFEYSTFSGSLLLPASLQRIKQDAFHSATFSGELQLPKNLSEIGHSSFKSSIFTGTIIISNVKYIQAYAFSSSEIEKVIRGNAEMYTGDNSLNTNGINRSSIRLKNSSYYNGTNA